MLQLDIFVVLAQLVNFGILYYIFKTFVADKLNAKMLEREAQLEKLNTAEDHYEQKMSLAAQQKDEMLDQARQTTATLMKESEAISREKANTIIKHANRQALAILDGGKRELEKERLTMLAQMKEHIVDVSLRLNEKMFGPGKTNKEFIEAEIAKMK
ncbi:ATP synthase F0 subunit B [Candidatus Gracilibacteria bacterium]|nr:ATP synthase F0 subunit B [Candidatus Gracilibacteria bacterium]